VQRGFIESIEHMVTGSLGIVMRVLERRFGRWLDLMSWLLAQPTAQFPRDLLLSELVASFKTRASWSWLTEDGVFGFTMHDPIPGWPPEDLVLSARGLAAHPLVRWYRTTGDTSAMSIGRVPAHIVDERALQVMRSHTCLVELDQQLAMPYRFNARAYEAFVLARGGPDFSDEDLVLARRVQSLIELLARQTSILRRAVAAVPDASLTGRELAVLRLLGDGRTAAAIGRRLGVSARTVHVHLDHIYRKLGVNDRMRAVIVARELGLLHVPSVCWPEGQPPTGPSTCLPPVEFSYLLRVEVC
jgi:DNA-binding CsgD family transcriptional regulator